MKVGRWIRLVMVLCSIDLAVPVWGAWNVSTVLSDATYGETDMALDSSGNAHVIYMGSGGLMHGYDDGSAWQTEVIDAQGFGSAILIDSSDQIHIAYAVSNGPPNYDFNINYAVKSGSTWNTQILAANINLLTSPRIDIDSFGYIHVGYCKYDMDNLVMDTHMSPSGWMDDIIGIATNIDISDFAFAIKPDDYRCFLIIVGAGTHDLTYGYEDSTGLYMEDLTGTAAALNFDLAVNSSSQPCFTALNEYTNTFQYFTRDAGGTWSAETVDANSVGNYTSLCLDSADNPYTIYTNGTGGGLKYAYKDGGSWQFETIEGGNVGRDNSIVMGSDGEPRCCYLDESKAGMRYGVHYTPLVPALGWPGIVMLLGAVGWLFGRCRRR